MAQGRVPSSTVSISMHYNIVQVGSYNIVRCTSTNPIGFGTRFFIEHSFSQRYFMALRKIGNNQEAMCKVPLRMFFIFFILDDPVMSYNGTQQVP